MLLISGIITIRKGPYFRFLEGQELSASAELFSIQELSLTNLTCDLFLLSTQIMKFIRGMLVVKLIRLNGGVILTVKSTLNIEENLKKRSSKVTVNR